MGGLVELVYVSLAWASGVEVDFGERLGAFGWGGKGRDCSSFYLALRCEIWCYVRWA